MKLDAFRSDTYFLSFGSVAFLFVVHFLVRSEKKCAVYVLVLMLFAPATHTQKRSSFVSLAKSAHCFRFLAHCPPPPLFPFPPSFPRLWFGRSFRLKSR